MNNYRKIIAICCVVGVIFVMEYNGYYWDPCDGNHCFAIDGYEVDDKTVFCDSLQCVEDNLEKTGTEHLDKIYKIEYDEENITIKRVGISYRATVNE